MFITLIRRGDGRSAARIAAGLVLVLGLGAASASAQTGLVAAYSFNEGAGTTVTDLSGNGNTGTVSGTTWSTTGKYGGALSFNGTSAVVTVPDAASLRLTTAMTLEAWVTPTQVTSWWRDVLYKGNDNYYLMATSSNASRPAAGGIFGTTGTNAFGTAAPAVNVWMHLAATYDGATLRLYVNGVQVSSVAQTGNLATSTNPLQIGGDTIYGQYFRGLIDEVRVYNVALTAAQVQADMNAALGIPGPSVPDLTLTKTHIGNFSQGQSGATYTLTARNGGTGTTTGTVTVSDTLPASLTATALSGTGWTCTLASLTCTRSDALPAGTSYPAITLTVAVSTTAPASVTNTATVSGGGQTQTANDTASNPTTIVAPIPDLTLTKTHVGNFTQGQTGATYTLTANNAGAGPTSGTVTVTDTLPASLTATALSGTGWTCTLAPLTCARSDALAAGAAYSAITLTVNVSTTAPASVTNTATVSGGSETNTANNSASNATTVNVLPVPDLTLTKTHVGNFTQGQTGATYTLTVTNGGTGATAGAVTVADSLPVSLTATAMSGTGWNCTFATATCTRSDALAAGASYPAITLTVNVSSSAPASVTNTAAVSGGGETNTANDSASNPTTINPPPTPDLTLTKTHVGNFTQGQAGATYTLSATNGGTGATSGVVTVIDTLPASLTASAMSGTGWSCTFATATCTRSDALAAGASYPAITLTVNVSSSAPASVTNTAAVSGGGETNTANDSASNPTTINPPLPPDLTLTKTHVGNFTQGQTGATYTLSATNGGTGATSGVVTVIDTLPASLTATAMSGTGWSCTFATATCTRSDALAAGASYPAITLTVNVSSSAPASVTNTAAVSGGGETNTANDSASNPTTINPPLTPDLTLTKTHVGNFTQGQAGATYTLSATNGGTGATTGTVTVIDTLPASLTATAMSGTGWSCTFATATCTRSDALAAGASYPAITLTVNVSSSAPASVTNTAAVSGGGETNTANDSASNPTTINPPLTPDLTLTKTHVGNFTQGQAGATYTLSATNGGTGATTGTVTVVDTLPASLTATAMSGTGWSCTFATATCTRSDALAAGASYPAITLTVTVAVTAPASITNTAAVSGGGETNTANDTANDVTIVSSQTSTGNLVGAYSFNEGTGTTVTDLSGRGNTGTVSGTAWAATGKYGGALSFDGTSALVTIPDAASLHLTTAMTLEAWINPAAANSWWQDVIYKGTDNYYLMATSSNASWPAAGGTFAGSGTDVFGTSVVPLNTWTHLAVTYDNATLRLYVNGVQVSSMVRTGSLATSTIPLQIGGDSIFGQYFRGLIDEVRVYDGALTATQVQSDMATAIGATPVPDLTLTKTHAGSFTQGQIAATYTLTVSNGGTAATSGTVTVTDTLPASLTATALGGTGWTCTLATLTCTRSDALGAAAGYPPITVTVNVSSSAPGSVTNTAVVSGGGETNTANDTASDLTTVSPPPVPDVTLTKTHTGNFTRGQTGATYALTVANAGTGATIGTVTVVDTLPASLTATAMSGTGWTCVVATRTCTRSDALAAAGSYPAITLTVDVAGTAPASVTNTAVVSGGGEINAANDTATDVTAIVAPDTENPSAPGTLTAVPVSGTQIDVSWGPATDNVGVVGYRLERCQGVGCTVFTKFGFLIPGTSFSDTSLSVATSYSYIVRAQDAVGNLGPYSNVATATTPATNPNLVTAYSFDEGTGTVANDLTGHSNTGTIQNATWTAAGKYGKALIFNGINAKVVVPDAAALHLTTGMTLEAWVSPRVVNTGWTDVIYKANDNFYLEGSTNAGPPGIGITVSGTATEAFATASLAAGVWKFLTATYDGTTLRFYVDGAQVSSQARTGSIATSTNPLEIGGDSLFGQFFDGTIDEIRIYNVALTPAQIQADMGIPLGATGAAVMLSTSSIDFGAQVAGTQSAPRSITLTNSGTATLNVESVSITGSEAADFAQTNGCVGTLAPSAVCTINVTFTPSSGGARNASVVISDNAAGNPHRVTLTGVGSGLFIAPRTTAITTGQTQQFTLGGTPAGPVTWSVDNVTGGSSAIGTITAAGLYTAPLTGGTHVIAASDGTTLVSATVYITTTAGIYTHRIDNSRTGQNLNETALTLSNVNTTKFGKLSSYAIDGIAHASPLYVAKVNIPAVGVRNVVYVATEHDGVYAFDADGRSSTPLWRVSFINPAAGITSVPNGDTGECCDITPEIGITGTPVIDPATATMYVVAKTKEPGPQYVQRLHALDIATGAEKFGGPVVIQASVPGTGAGSVGGTLAFDPLRENQRTALLLRNGIVYFGFGSHGDVQPYHGWLLGYNATTLQRVLVFCTTPNGEGGGIWQSGGGLAVDSSGNFIFATGDGTFTKNTGGIDYGNTFLRVSPAGTVLDFFTPQNQGFLDSNNLDLDAGGMILLPDQTGAVHPHILVSSGKDGSIYVVDRDSMGGFNNPNRNVQTLANIFPFGTPLPGNYSSPVYYNGTVYFAPVADVVQAFRLSNGLLPTSATTTTAQSFGYPGAALSVSANGTVNGILWAIRKNAGTGTLHAYDAGNLASEIYNSDQAGTRDTLAAAAKFSLPLVVNGHVYVASEAQFTIYGLLP